MWDSEIENILIKKYFETFLLRWVALFVIDLVETKPKTNLKYTFFSFSPRLAFLFLSHQMVINQMLAVKKTKNQKPKTNQQYS